MRHLVVLAAVLTIVVADLIHTKGKCPGDRKTGEKWQETGCRECNCKASGYVCASCDDTDFFYERDTCYLEADDDIDYPECCVPDLVCRGDEGFNATKLQQARARPTPRPRPIKSRIVKVKLVGKVGKSKKGKKFGKKVGKKVGKLINKAIFGGK
ncbi:uncharacterized protein LOC131954248 [Physella acuta]|uniref:uncharacterized protein LOC131954248 n=1 Tax=Physella acuta TaxID=109671 RepID=UPI0027DAC5DF|nr:uncharacterized protein LOC131954248 [Physella acuta]